MTTLTKHGNDSSMGGWCFSSYTEEEIETVRLLLRSTVGASYTFVIDPLLRRSVGV